MCDGSTQHTKSIANNIASLRADINDLDKAVNTLIGLVTPKKDMSAEDRYWHKLGEKTQIFIKQCLSIDDKLLHQPSVISRSYSGEYSYRIESTDECRNEGLRYMNINILKAVLEEVATKCRA
jgi:hypothetical protein